MSVGASSLAAREAGTDEVVLVHAGVRRYALASVFDFRDKEVTDFPVEDVTAVEIDSHRNGTSWNRSPGGEWFTVQGGDTIRGDETEIEAILRELRALRARDILDDAHEVSDPAGSVVVHLVDDAPIRLSFSSADSQRCRVRLQRETRTNVVDASALDVFDRSLHDLRDRRILRFDKDLLGKVTLVTEKLSISIVKTGDDWLFSNPSFGEIDPALVSTFLTALGTLRYREIVEERIRNVRDMRRERYIPLRYKPLDPRWITIKMGKPSFSAKRKPAPDSWAPGAGGKKGLTLADLKNPLERARPGQ